MHSFKSRFFFFSTLFIVIVIAISSCNKNGHQKETQAIDLLLQTLDSSESIFNSIDTLRINSVRRDMKEKGEAIKKMDLKEFSNELKIKVSNFMSATKGFKTYRKHYHRIKDEIPTTRKQLMDLKKDLQQGAWEKVDIEKHIATETHIVNGIENTINQMLSGNKYALTQYQNVEPQISALLIELQRNE